MPSALTLLVILLAGVVIMIGFAFTIIGLVGEVVALIALVALIAQGAALLVRVMRGRSARA